MMNKQLEKLALETLNSLNGRGNLETRNNDDEDFFEVSIWGLRDLLEKAYELGKQDGKVGE